MKTYNRQFINKDIKSVAEQSLELHNGIIWSINSTAYNCGVKVLGSTDIIQVDFPPSWMVIPNWVQLGCPVQMSHRNGFRNTLEIIGPGHIIPAQKIGENTPYANPSTLTNRVLSGCVVSEVSLVSEMSVDIDSGVVRIGGDTVSVTSVNTTITAAPASVNNCRYDLIAVGTDAAIDLITGTTFRSSATAATIPDLPEAHFELARILIHYGQTAINDNDIDRVWSKAVPHVIDISANNTDLSSAVSTASITAEVRDQYQNPVLEGSSAGWAMELEVLSGAGSISSTAGTSTAVIDAQTGSSAGYIFHFIIIDTTVDTPAIFTARLTTILVENSFGITIRTSN